jgi:hypothetical protein
MKKYIHKLLLLTGMIMILLPPIRAQVPTTYYDEASAVPYVFTPQEGVFYEVPPIDVTPYQDEDIELDAGNNPYRFGAPIATELNVVEQTALIYTEQYKVRKMDLYAAEAKSLNVVFENLSLPEGTMLFIYNASGRMLQGPIVQEMIPEGGRLGSNVFGGDKITIECAQPLESAATPTVQISKIVYGYREYWGADGNYGASENCNVDVRCPEGDDWCVQQRTATRLLINDNAFCSGGAINNAASDLNRPYILTADHCLGASSNFGNWQFEFHYKNPFCGANSYTGITWGFTGATLRANWGGTDFALMELNTYNPANNIHRLTGIHFAGFNRAAAASTEATGIHHPNGDVMKISIDFNGAVAANWPGTPANSHWRADFNVGTVEHGSSGSPLFDQNQRIVGQLHGNLNYVGQPYCDTPNGWYGRLNMSWNGNGTPATRLVDWLGPLAGNTVDAFCAPIIYHNEQITGNAGLHTATHAMELEGRVNGYPPPFPIGGTIFPPNNVAFSVSGSGSAAYQAGESVTILPGVHFDKGSSVSVFIEDVECNDGLDYHYSITDETSSMVKQTPALLNSTVDELEDISELELYPNPANTTLNIELTGEQKITSLQIVNNQGQAVNVYRPLDTQQRLVSMNVAHLPSGLYTLIVGLEHGLFTSKRFVIGR